MVEPGNSGNEPGADGGGGRSDGGTEAAVPLDTVFDLLSNARRQYLLYHLYETEGGLSTLDEAAEAVFEYERGEKPPAESGTRRQVRITLHHAHIPRVADTGLLEYDARQGDIRLWDDSGLRWIEYTLGREVRGASPDG